MLEGEPIGIQPSAEEEPLTFAAPVCYSAVQGEG